MNAEAIEDASHDCHPTDESVNEKRPDESKDAEAKIRTIFYKGFIFYWSSRQSFAYRIFAVMSQQLSKEQLINIADQFGTPVYVYHAEKIEEQHNELCNALQIAMPNFFMPASL